VYQIFVRVTAVKAARAMLAALEEHGGWLDRIELRRACRGFEHELRPRWARERAIRWPDESDIFAATLRGMVRYGMVRRRRGGLSELYALPEGGAS